MHADLSPDTRELLPTHKVACELLKHLAESKQDSNEKGYGILLSSKSAYDTKERLKATVEDALEEAGESYGI